MLPANATLLRCPHCGAKKEVIQLMSGNTIGATLWSDTKHIAPMLPQVFPIQRCPNCGKYFFYTIHVIAGTSHRYSSQSGELPLEYLKEALAQLQSTDDRERSLRFLILWAFNDRYGQLEQSEIPTEEWDYHIDNVQHLLAMDICPLMNAELYREIGQFEECIKILMSDQIDDELQGFRDQILAAAKKHNRKVIALYGEAQRQAITLDNYHETTYTPPQIDEDDKPDLPF